MKWTAIVFATLLSTSAFARSAYDLVSVPHSEIDSYMTRGTEELGTPANLQGLWWMNGNPLPDEVVSFAGIAWKEIAENGVIVGYSGLVPVYDQGIWSWHDSISGRTLYNLVLKNKLTYEVVFNADFTFAQVTPKIKPVAFLPTITIPESMLVDFEMRQVDSDEFARDSVLLGQPSTYRFRRIVDGEGNRLPAWKDFLKAVETPNALLPICKDNVNETIPSQCVK